MRRAASTSSDCETDHLRTRTLSLRPPAIGSLWLRTSAANERLLSARRRRPRCQDGQSLGFLALSVRYSVVFEAMRRGRMSVSETAHAAHDFFTPLTSRRAGVSDVVRYEGQARSGSPSAEPRARRAADSALGHSAHLSPTGRKPIPGRTDSATRPRGGRRGPRRGRYARASRGSRLPRRGPDRPRQRCSSARPRARAARSSRGDLAAARATAGSVYGRSNLQGLRESEISPARETTFERHCPPRSSR